MAKKRVKKKSSPKKSSSKPKKKDDNRMTLAVVGLILNVLILPGVGTIVGGDSKTGITQLILFLIGIPLVLVIVGIPLMFAMWVWGIVSSVNQIRDAQ